ncbi:MAG: CAAX prenyl protease-related protein [Candidatus Scalindua rubra]|uniref:CAAX amino terminal protease self-immunity n=1 Tax=Candidatus Scalindua brodae TaxID=237368 RepID=A0A0B0ELI8_9BACT|nr:MAG: CAAX amino terminal protease self- immunity [Candidatus Scalindua brodae]MBZ0109706.1 CAAX prenyl protease-related protein [Candidatus Scalindua rubra]TWU32423.1 CAAX amino terminal protease self- immunity [Candidatus Brocadiaceae bacterium S225]
MLRISDTVKTAWFPRVFPFLLFVTFIALESLIEFISRYYAPLVIVAEYDSYIFYPIKTVLVGIAMLFMWKRYTEINMRNTFSVKNVLVGLMAGAGVFVLWINMDMKFATMSEPKEFNPFIIDNSLFFYLIISFRLFGSSVVVPVFEEIFWRSFIIRYIINPKFENVPVGQFTWLSFVISSIFFGLEHNLWLAGIMAGVSYSLVLYYTRNLVVAMFSHGVTNLLLGIYVLTTGNWQFW